MKQLRHSKPARFEGNLAGLTFSLRQATLRIALSTAFFMLCRLIFYVYNRAILPNPTLTDFLWGIRFDLSAAMYVNVLVLLTYILPLSIQRKKGVSLVQKTLFIVPNALAFGVELMDVAFFRFQNRRTLLTDLGLVKNTTNLLPSYLAEYWFLIVGFIVFLWLLHFLYDKTTLELPSNALKNSLENSLKNSINSLENSPINLLENSLNPLVNPSHSPEKTSFLTQLRSFLIAFSISILSVILWLIAARGGTQLRPITPLSTADFVSDMRLMPLMSNTTLNFLHSTGQTFLVAKTYMPDAEAAAIYPIYAHPTPVDSFRKLNVVILALESFGKEYSKYFNSQITDYQGYTPFLDSLAQASLQAEQSFANGLRSAQGIAAITAGLPSLMEEQFVFSPYQSNRLDGLAAHLKQKGYETAFFHGSNPGSMEFDKFAHLTGFSNFYDRYGYGNQADFDGNWGIWDAPMLQFVAQKLTKTPEPFYSFFFSLTSHHPYNVPKDFEEKYPNIDPLHRSVLYTDDAMRQFFETAKKQAWFDRTLFVIVADHVGAGTFVPKYQTKVGRYRIPILFYKPNEIKAEIRPNIVQQQDIMPSILDFLRYDKSFLSFGRSLFDKNRTPQYSFNFEEGLYQIQDNRYVLFFDGDQTTGLYDYTTDVFLKNNLKNSQQNEKERLEKVIKSVIQQYHKAMTTNKLAPQ